MKMKNLCLLLFFFENNCVEVFKNSHKGMEVFTSKSVLVHFSTKVFVQLGPKMGSKVGCSSGRFYKPNINLKMHRVIQFHTL